MRKYKLTINEECIIKKFQCLSIPYIFKSGEYCGYMQYFEYIDFEICYRLLKGEVIDKKNYEKIFLEDLNFYPKILIEKLDDYALDFYNYYLKIKKIVKKYYT